MRCHAALRPEPVGRLGRAIVGPVVLGLAGALLVAACGDDGGDPQVARGRSIVEDVGCTACHSTGTTPGIGPAWGGSWGTERELVDGTTAVVDEDYLRRAVVDPSAEVAAGFQVSMPIVPLSDEEVDAVVAYLRDVTGGGS